jgi:hypothetical protein
MAGGRRSDPELKADLCAPHWQPRAGRIIVESKEEIARRLHRSTDCGDAAVLAHYEGPARTPVVLYEL